MQGFLATMAGHFEGGAMLFALPVLWVLFASALALRWAIHAKVRGQYRFLAEVERRVHRRFSDPQRSRSAFGPLVRQVLEGALEDFYAAPKLDGGKKMSGSARRQKDTSSALVSDVASHASEWRYGIEAPRFLETARYALGSNRGIAMVGSLTLGGCHRFLNATPALFLFIGAALTLLGLISVSAPAIGVFDTAKSDAIGSALRLFLEHLPFTLLFAASGVVQAAAMQLANALLDPERVFVNATNKLAGALAVLWQDTAPAKTDVEADVVPEELQLSDTVEDISPVEKPAPAPVAAPAPAPTPSAPAASPWVTAPVPPASPWAAMRAPQTPQGAGTQRPAPSTDWGTPSAPTPKPATPAHVRPAPKPMPINDPAARHIEPDENTFIGELPPTPISAPTPAPVPSAPVEELMPEPVTGSWNVAPPTPAPAPVPVVQPMAPPPQPEMWGQPQAEPVNEDRFAVLKHRLGVIEQYLEKAAEDRMHGLISEEMWQEESTRWTAEREKLTQEIAQLAARAGRAA